MGRLMSKRPEQRTVEQIRAWLDTPMANPDSIHDLTHDLALAARDLRWTLAEIERLRDALSMTELADLARDEEGA